MNPPPPNASNGFVGNSPALARIRQIIEKIAPSRTPVLLLGESGTGKEVLARALHDANPAGAFVPIDCGSLVGPLMESELFGHTKGSFTGASETKRGLIELAHGGTAFFDEIGDLPLELQVKLLRLLQEREYRPVGSLTRHKVDIRVIAATHRDLAREVERGTFRQDLYYRLNVISIRIPPLRDRKEDIPALVERFLRRSQTNYSITQETLDAMLTYEWPGNVRELQNCVDRMIAMNSGPLLHIADLPSALHNWLLAAKTGLASFAAAASAQATGASPRPAVVPLHEIEKRAIIEALVQTKGDRGVAAHLLGIGRTTLYRKLKEYHVEA
ncbi:MAG: sigma-54 dependent transcriptional regulator [Acidobacteriota bacterium]|nr:sigma-54 dependent transcriptional regulator [Acidobacteriota bacterium]